MKRLLYFGIVVVLTFSAYWLGSTNARKQAASSSAAGARKVLYYVDPMNPAHTSDKPGKAPCGMDMEPVYADSLPVAGTSNTPMAMPQGTLKVSSEKQQLIGVRAEPVEKKQLLYNVRLLAKVATDETRIFKLNATVDGWITKALPIAQGSQVKKNETLAEFYSPEFLGAAQALLFAVTAADRAKGMSAANEAQQSQLANVELNLKQYRDGLKNLGMGDVQIDEMIKTRVRPENVKITSPSDGFILLRNVSDGQRFDKGTELFRIADMSKVWIIVDVFEKDAGIVQTEQPVKVSLPSHGKIFTACVSKTLPQFDNVTRTLKLRLEVENPDFVLKPDMFVDVELPLSLPESIVIPSEAVVDAGLRQTVYVDRGNGYFEPRNIQVGSRVGDQVQVVHGLSAGERVVTSGNFLLDSESRMKLAASGMLAEPVTDPVCGMAVDEAKAKTASRTSEYQGKTYSFCSLGCKKNFDANSAKFLNKGGAPMKEMAAEPLKDVVCGMKVDKDDAVKEKLTSEHQGKTYYFCNETCKKQFDADPAKFLGKVKETAGSTHH